MSSIINIYIYLKYNADFQAINPNYHKSWKKQKEISYYESSPNFKSFVRRVLGIYYGMQGEQFESTKALHDIFQFALKNRIFDT